MLLVDVINRFRAVMRKLVEPISAASDATRLLANVTTDRDTRLYWISCRRSVVCGALQIPLPRSLLMK